VLYKNEVMEVVIVISLIRAAETCLCPLLFGTEFVFDRPFGCTSSNKAQLALLIFASATVVDQVV
jgi:hypothetical protein